MTVAPTTFVRRRRTRLPGLRGTVLAAICLLMGLLAISWVVYSALSQPTSTPSGQVEVTETRLQPGMIAFQLQNDDTRAITIAQVAINDAFWPFTAAPGAIIPHRGAATLTLSYPWDAGVSYDVQFISSTGTIVETSLVAATIDATAASP